MRRTTESVWVSWKKLCKEKPGILQFSSKLNITISDSQNGFYCAWRTGSYDARTLYLNTVNM